MSLLSAIEGIEKTISQATTNIQATTQNFVENTIGGEFAVNQQPTGQATFEPEKQIQAPVDQRPPVNAIQPMLKTIDSIPHGRLIVGVGLGLLAIMVIRKL